MKQYENMLTYHNYRYITIPGGREVPVGVFISYRDIIKYAVKQMVERKFLRLTPDTILMTKWNQGMDGASSHPEIFGKDAAALVQSGHTIKSCQSFVVVLLSGRLATVMLDEVCIQECLLCVMFVYF